MLHISAKGITIALAALLCIITAFLTIYPTKTSVAIYPSGSQMQALQSAPSKPAGPYVTIGDVYIEAELATTTIAVTKGLSGRDVLPSNTGMLFLFKKKDILKFWMPDMRFSLDMIWIDNGVVMDITHNASHVFDQNNPIFYGPKAPVRYVLEVNAGFAQMNGIQIGDPVSFNNLP